MTDYERQEIYKLRKEGLGYQAIGTILGLTRDAVRSFCKRNNLNGNAEVVGLNIEVMKEKELLCINCARLMKTKDKGRPRKYCSDDCRRTWWKNNKNKTIKGEAAIYKHKCLYCKKEFTIWKGNPFLDKFIPNKDLS